MSNMQSSFLNQLKADTTSMRKELASLKASLTSQLGVKLDDRTSTTLLGEVEDLTMQIRATIAAGQAFVSARTSLATLVFKKDLKGLFSQLVERVSSVEDKQLLDLEDFEKALEAIKRKTAIAAQFDKVVGETLDAGTQTTSVVRDNLQLEKNLLSDAQLAEAEAAIAAKRSEPKPPIGDKGKKPVLSKPNRAKENSAKATSKVKEPKGSKDKVEPEKKKRKLEEVKTTTGKKFAVPIGAADLSYPISVDAEGNVITVEQLLRFHHVAFKPALEADEERVQQKLDQIPRPEEDHGTPNTTHSGFKPVGEASKDVDDGYYSA